MDVLYCFETITYAHMPFLLNYPVLYLGNITWHVREIIQHTFTNKNAEENCPS